MKKTSRGVIWTRIALALSAVTALVVAGGAGSAWT